MQIQAKARHFFIVTISHLRNDKKTSQGDSVLGRSGIKPYWIIPDAENDHCDGNLFIARC
jgi:hypothetical protein